MSKYKPTKEQRHAEYIRNKDRYMASARRWVKANPDKRKVISKRDNDKRSELKKRWWQINKFGTLIELDECKRCGSIDKLVVHHNDGKNGRMGKPLNNDIENLVVLCRSCHARIHSHGMVKELIC